MTRSHYTGQPKGGLAGQLIAALFTVVLFSAGASAEVRSVEGLEFSRVQLQGSNQLEISSGESNSLKIRASEGKLEPLPFVLDGDTLRLGITSDGDTVSDIKYKLTATQLQELKVVGSGDAFVKPLRVPSLLVALDGSGSIRLYDITAQQLELQLIGSGDLQAARIESRDTRLQVNGSGDLQLGSLVSGTLKVHLAGSGDITIEDDSRAESLEVGLLGSGDVALSRLTAGDAKVSIMGSGDVEVRVLKTLEADIMGSGDLLYRGSPELSTSIFGSGEVSKQD